jgi:hypothetical protein
VAFGATDITVNGVLPPEGTYVFRDGFNGYAGTQDTEVRAASPDSPNGSATTFRADASDGDPAGPVHGLLRFDDIIGTEEGQVSPTAGIASATLTLNVTNPGSGATVHRMATAWDESSTWNSLGAGIQADGVEAVAVADVSLGANNSSENIATGFTTIDVTESLLAWKAGEDNLGWAFLPYANGTNGLAFESSESSNVPILTIVTLPENVVRARFQDGLKGYDGTTDTGLREYYPTTSYGTATSVCVDTADPSGYEDQVLIWFEDLFGTESGQVPTEMNIISATLVLNVHNEGSGFSMHRMLQDWAESDTWDSLLGGVSADDIEALADADAIAVSVSTGLLEVDVTESILAWLSGETNYGWVLLPTGSNGVDFYTSEYGTDSLRPMLYIDYEVPEPTGTLLLVIGVLASLGRRCRRPQARP